MDDATSRAREVIAQYMRDFAFEDTARMHAAGVVRHLTETGFQIIDTRTHAAVPREPSEAVVERVARIIVAAVPDSWGERRSAADVDFMWPEHVEEARAAIAALTGVQTQGGEPDV